MQVHRRADDIRAAGGELIVIGNGAPHFIAGFRELTRYTGALYTDPTLAAYEAAHLERGVTKTLSARALVPTLRAFARGGRQGTIQGDNWQQGGVMVVATDGVVLYHHASRRPGDNASPDDIVAALRS